MKVISLIQPWASLLVLGIKKIETRSWDTKHRGDILIHASKKKSKAYLHVEETLRQWWGQDLNKLPAYDELPFGAIIGKAHLAKTIQFGRDEPTDTLDELYQSLTAPRQQNIEISLGNFEPGRWGWVMEYPQEIVEPIAINGSLGIWNYNEGGLVWKSLAPSL
jgi:hypothetical protein